MRGDGGTLPKIRLRGLRKAFGAKQVLDGVDLDVAAGHGTVILGGSGSGKSVTLKCILGLIEPDAGTIEIDGRDVLHMPRAERQEVLDRRGMLFQNGALFDSLPVWENVCFKLLAQNRITRAAARERAAEVLEQARSWPAPPPPLAQQFALILVHRHRPPLRLVQGPYPGSVQTPQRIHTAWSQTSQ